MEKVKKKKKQKKMDNANWAQPIPARGVRPGIYTDLISE
jgi:hypothetical protein